jgi:hypothetical protein
MTTLSEVPGDRGLRRRASAAIPGWAWYTIAIYLLTRLLYLAVAGVDSGFQHWSLQQQMGNWDGYWYLRTTTLGYPHVIPSGVHAYSTLGLLPLYPMLMWGLAKLPLISVFGAGLAIAMACGLGAVLQMSRLASRWWGEDASRRAILFFCLFPGTIVFSMVYSEGLQLLLVTTALLALEDRRWWTAGICAGLATAVSPVALAIIPACLVAAWRELQRHGWTDRQALRSLIAPVLSPAGLIGFGIFLWIWVGTPFASYIAQNHAWEESSTPLAVPLLFGHLFGDLLGIESVQRLGPGGIDINAANGALGALLFIWGMYLLWRYRHRVHLTALVWTAGVFVLTFTSAKTPPNARMLICAFPMLLAVGVRCRGRWRWAVYGLELVLIGVMSYFTYVGSWLRP